MGYRNDDLLAFKLQLNNPSKIAELQELEHWDKKFNVAGNATEGYFSKRWIAEHLFGMSEDEFLRNQREMFFDKKLRAKLEAAATGGEAGEDAGGGGGLAGGLGDLGGGGGDTGGGDLGGDLVVTLAVKLVATPVEVMSGATKGVIPICSPNLPQNVMILQSMLTYQERKALTSLTQDEDHTNATNLLMTKEKARRRCSEQQESKPLVQHLVIFTKVTLEMNIHYLKQKVAI